MDGFLNQDLVNMGLVIPVLNYLHLLCWRCFYHLLVENVLSKIMILRWKILFDALGSRSAMCQSQTLCLVSLTQSHHHS